MTPSLAALLVAVLVSVAGAVPPIAAAPGVLRGRVEVLHPLRAMQMPRAAGSRESAAPESRRQAVVYFENVPSEAEAPAATRAQMHQTQETFVPHLIAITVGSSVDFPNDDRTYHNVFSLSKTKRFDLGRYATGHSKSVTFDRPGIVRVFCDIHSHMNAFVLVFDHPYFAITDDEGRYRIDRVPPGTYRVTAWYEGVAQESQSVTVSSGGTSALDFTLR